MRTERGKLNKTLAGLSFQSRHDMFQEGKGKSKFLWPREIWEKEKRVFYVHQTDIFEVERRLRGIVLFTVKGGIITKFHRNCLIYVLEAMINNRVAKSGNNEAKVSTFSHKFSFDP